MSSLKADRVRAEIQKVAPILVLGRRKESVLEAIAWVLYIVPTMFLFLRPVKSQRPVSSEPGSASTPAPPQAAPVA